MKNKLSFALLVAIAMAPFIALLIWAAPDMTWTIVPAGIACYISVIFRQVRKA